MYIFMYVPAADRMAPATSRNRVGPLSMQPSSAGGGARARSGHLQLRSASSSRMYICFLGNVHLKTPSIGICDSYFIIRKRLYISSSSQQCIQYNDVP